MAQPPYQKLARTPMRLLCNYLSSMALSLPSIKNCNKQQTVTDQWQASEP